MTWGFLSTSDCLNDCIICCMATQPTCAFYPVGNCDTDLRGLSVLFEALKKGQISLSGGDPLRNYAVLELASKQANSLIMVNPLSFLTLQSGQRARNITPTRAREIRLTIAQKGFIPSVQRLLVPLSQFTAIGLSCGNLQSPYPELMHDALALFDDRVRPELGKARIINESVTGTILSGDISFVGRCRQAAENGLIPGIELQPCSSITQKSRQCNRDSDFYFKRGLEGTSLYLMTCCTAGYTPQVTFKTKLTLENMADSQPESLYQEILSEQKRMRETAWHQLLCGNSPDERQANFDEYLDAANSLIRDRTTCKVDVRRLRTPDGNEAHWCEICYNASLKLYEAGVSPRQWHEYLERI